MKELRLGHRLVHQAEELLGPDRPTTIHVQAGALSNISPTVLRRVIEAAAIGTRLDGVEVVFHVGSDPLAEDALRVFVSRVDVAA